MSNAERLQKIENDIFNAQQANQPSKSMSELLDEKFANVRKTAGIQIWRIEKLEMAAVDEKTYGTFYGGDSYIILRTIEERSGSLTRNIHFWLGEECSVDERGAAAIWSTHLDDWFGGEPVQFRETQNGESQKFMGYFKNGITYKKGGVASAFNSVKTNQSDARSLYQVKGKRRPRIVEVDCEWDSLNEGDVFILDYKNFLIQWNGKEANRHEKLKACFYLNEINTNGRNQIKNVDQGRVCTIMEECLGPMPSSFKPATDDLAFEKKKSVTPPKLYKFLDTSALAEGKDIKQDMLDEENIYLLIDNSRVYSWKGKKASRAARKELSYHFDDFLADVKFTGSPSVEMLNQGLESASFKQLFGIWKTGQEADPFTKPESSSKIAKSIYGIDHLDIDDSMHSAVRKDSVNPLNDDGKGEITIWRIETGNDTNELKEIDREQYGEFFGGDCYIIKYENFNVRPKIQILYFWIGMNSTIDEQGAVAHHVVQMDNNAGGCFKQERVVQGKEPAHLQQIFGSLIMYKGGTSRTRGESKRAETALFQVRASIHGFNRTIECDCSAANLNSNDAFVLIEGEMVFIWLGQGASGREKIGATEAVEGIMDGGGDTPIVVNEGEEDDAFWEAIGGKKEYAKISDEEGTDNAKLFVCSNASGKMTVDEIGEDFTQDDLISDDVMILDGGKTIFIWVGKGSNQEEKKHGPEIARRYQAGCSGRKTLKTVDEGDEPMTFRGFFQAWQDNYDPQAKFDSMQAQM